jgi:hypothetical protein
VVFPELDGLVLSSAASRDEIGEMLGKACRVATVEYGKIKERESMLPGCVALFQRLGKNMYLYVFLYSDISSLCCDISLHSFVKLIVPEDNNRSCFLGAIP